jgi:uncharacterized protein YgbK (DUF1537 family)
MSVLRLLADDLTGALDSAARFVPLVGPVPVVWSSEPPPGTMAMDSGTRDLDPVAAAESMRRLAGIFVGDIAFKKIDSLLRGHVVMELAACLPGFDHCVFAPAFPFQGRITRDGRQLVREGNEWRDTGTDLSALPVRVMDAVTEADLDDIVAYGRSLSGRVLWVGTGGLAGALAGRMPVACPDLRRPILALIGSNHPVTMGQLSAIGRAHHCLGAGVAFPIEGPAAVTVRVPPGTARHQATGEIIAAFMALLSKIPRPGTLFVTGGATLRAFCEALGADCLIVDGEVEPGVPTSVLRGGQWDGKSWDGQRIVSKSGAFGDSNLLARLLAC